MVRDYTTQPSGDVTTTYDKLIQHYADLHAERIDAAIAQGKAQEILDAYADVTRNTDPASAEAQWASDRIDELVQKFTSLYELSIETVEEFNQVNGADNIKMKNSIVVNAKLNLKLYAALSVILFLFLAASAPSSSDGWAILWTTISMWTRRAACPTASAATPWWTATAPFV